MQPTPLFASDRERRLWIWTTLVVVGIFSTVGVVPRLASVPHSQTALAVVFVACMAFIALSILTQGLKARPRGVEIGVALGLAGVYFLVLVRLALPQRSHLMEYGVLAVFVYEALTERRRQGRHVPAPALLTIVATSLVGAVDEFVQVFIPSRVFEWTDLLFNFLAGLMATVSMVLLGWARRWRFRGES